MEQFNQQHITIVAPVIRSRKGHYRELFDQIRKQGFNKIRLDGNIVDLTPGMQVDRFKIHDIEVVVDRIQIDKKMKERIIYNLQTALRL